MKAPVEEQVQLLELQRHETEAAHVAAAIKSSPALVRVQPLRGRPRNHAPRHPPRTPPRLAPICRPRQRRWRRGPPLHQQRALPRQICPPVLPA